MTSTDKSRKSKRQSGSNSTSKQLEALVFFVDECLGTKKVPAALMAAGATVKTLADVFSKGVTDQDWLIGLSAHDWVVLTKDKNIRRRPNEFEAFAAAGLRVFVITATNLTGEENGRILVKALPKILRFCKNYRPPFVAGITRMSEVTLLDLQRFGLIVTRKKGR